MSNYKIVTVFIFFSLLGLFVVPLFTVDLQPTYNLPVLTVYFSLPDASPETVEQEATSPLENGLSQIPNIQKIYSVSGYDRGSIELTFDKEVDLDFKKFEVLSLVRQLYPNLNPRISYPTVEQRARETESKRVLLLYRINASLALAQIKNIKDVQITGAEGTQISVDYNVHKLNKHGVAVSSISQKISQTFNSLFPAKIEMASGQKLVLKVENSLYNIEQLGKLAIPCDSAFLLLNYFAHLYFEETQPTQYFRINGQNSITLGIYADGQVNRARIAGEVKEKVAQLSRALPAGYALSLDYDDTEFLIKEINKNFMRSSLSLGLLLIFVFMAYRNWRHLVILSTGILINLCLTSLAANWLSISIHLYTIAGLTISFGMMVDNSIVMLDHLKRSNNNKIFAAIIGATLTTVTALLLILFLPEVERQNLTEFSFIVALALTCSILVATFYIPAVYHLIFAQPALQKEKISNASLRKKVKLFQVYFSAISFLARYKKAVILFLILAFGIPVFMLPPKWEGQDWYNKTIGSDLYQEEIRPYSDKLLGGSLRMFVRNVYERSGYRDAEKTRLYVNASLPYGHTLDDMDRVVRNMENYLQPVQGLDKYITHVSSGQHATITILFEDRHENGALPYQLKGRLIAQSLDWGGVEWNIYGVGRGFSNSVGESLPNFNVELKGYNFHELEKQAQVLADELLKHKRIQKVNTNERLSWNEKSADQLVLSFNQARLHALSISPGQLARALRERTQGNVPTLTVTLNQESVPVYVQPEGGKNFSVFQVMEESMLHDGASIQLKSVANLKKERTVNAIHKEDRQYLRQVGFDYYGSYQFGNKYLDEVLARQKPSMPAGYTAEKISWSFSWAQAKRQYGLLILLMVAIYLISAVLFESLRLPFYIVLTIPLSFIGLFLAFSLFDFYFDQGGYAAFVLLGGLVVNSSIFILTSWKQLPRITDRGMAKATAGKFRPIMLTVLSTCLGLTPFLMGSQNEVFWFSLAAGTIGGLAVSIVTSFIVLPVLLLTKGISVTHVEIPW